VSDAAAEPWAPSPSLDTTVSRPRAGAVLLAVAGEVDTRTAPDLEAGLNAALDAAADEPGAGVVVDLGTVTFLASSGLAVLIRGANRATDLGRRLHLVAVTRAVARPLQVTGADVLFETHADVDSALAVAAAEGVAPPPGE
jgi:anti-sigma B factor antagonist